MVPTLSSLANISFLNGVLYLDPGTGSVILQGVIAVLMSVLFILGVFRKRIAALLKRIFRAPPAGSEGGSGQPDDE
jgi:hypothetical protein